MGTRTMLFLLVAVGCAALFVHPGTVAQGDDGVRASGVWVFDLRVVRVDTNAVETTEKAGAWEPEGDGTTTTAWPDLLKALKERGKTLLLLDQRVTTVGGRDVSATQTKDVQIKMFQNSDFNNERHQSSSVSSGCEVKLRPGVDASAPVDCDVKVRWVLVKRENDLRPMLGTSNWHCTHGGLHEKTLVLAYREQIEHLDGERQGLEIYAFITGRYVP